MNRITLEVHTPIPSLPTRRLVRIGHFFMSSPQKRRCLKMAGLVNLSTDQS